MVGLADFDRTTLPLTARVAPVNTAQILLTFHFAIHRHRATSGRGGIEAGTPRWFAMPK